MVSNRERRKALARAKYERQQARRTACATPVPPTPDHRRHGRRGRRGCRRGLGWLPARHQQLSSTPDPDGAADNFPSLKQPTNPGATHHQPLPRRTHDRERDHRPVDADRADHDADQPGRAARERRTEAPPDTPTPAVRPATVRPAPPPAPAAAAAAAPAALRPGRRGRVGLCHARAPASARSASGRRVTLRLRWLLPQALRGAGRRGRPARPPDHGRLAVTRRRDGDGRQGPRERRRGAGRRRPRRAGRPARRARPR